VDTTLVIGPGTGEGRLVGGRYRIIAPLARGGMSEVVEALDERLHRRVALKLLAPSIAEDAAAATRFEREARAVAGLSHPGIVTIYDHGTDGVPFIVMELIEGPTLKGMIEQRAPFHIDNRQCLNVEHVVHNHARKPPAALDEQNARVRSVGGYSIKTQRGIHDRDETAVDVRARPGRLPRS